jgi:hypothetical protein
MTDSRSSLAVELMSADPHAYEKLVVAMSTSPAARQRLDPVKPEQLVRGKLQSFAAASAMLAGLWLWHDGLDECHRIVQQSPRDVERAHAGRAGAPLAGASTGGASAVSESRSEEEMTATYSLWHAIMHRREGDFSNSKYWYARCAEHPIYPSLSSHASAILNPLPADTALVKINLSGWNPNAFVDLVEAVHEHPADPRAGVAIALQKLEWRVLFDHCTRAAAM